MSVNADSVLNNEEIW
jgi:hypothetical protein